MFSAILAWMPALALTCSAKAPFEWSAGSPWICQQSSWSFYKSDLTSSCKSCHTITDLEVLHAVADFFNDSGVVASDNGSLGRSVFNALPVCGIESHGLGPDDDEVVLSLWDGDVRANFRDALLDLDYGLLGRTDVRRIFADCYCDF